MTGVQRLKTRPQFQAVLAGETVARTTHFALHRLVFSVDIASSIGPGAVQSSDLLAPQALFGVPGPWLGAMVPKRWARRAVTRNAIKRQIYALSAGLAPQWPAAAHVVRLRAEFNRKHFVSAVSEPLKQAVRHELELLFRRAASPAAGSGQGPAP